MKPLLKYWPLAVAILLYILYALTHIYWFRWSIIVFLLIYVLVLILRKAPKRSRGKYLFVPVAFGFSVIGDMFLHFDGGKAILFITGVAFYLFAHVFYICFTLRQKKVNWGMFAFLAVLFTAYFIWLLIPSIPETGVRIAVILYILISCLSVSTASGMPLGPDMDRSGKILVITGISFLLFSDFLISLHDFIGVSTGYFLMLPTFYLSQILVSAALIHLLDRNA